MTEVARSSAVHRRFYSIWRASLSTCSPTFLATSLLNSCTTAGFQLASVFVLMDTLQAAPNVSLVLPALYAAVIISATSIHT